MSNSITTIELVVIDPQEDFCRAGGALYVDQAEGDIDRLAAMIRRLLTRLDDIHVTLDCHHLFDIAHPMFWKGPDGKVPNVFTMISHADVQSGTWTPTVPSLTKWALHYTLELEKGGRYPLCIWPPHCLIGSKGNTIMPELFESLLEWEAKNTAIVDYVSKGSNYLTEHYSGVKAEVPDPNDPTTQLNTNLIQTLERATFIGIAGEASSHCIFFTIRDVIEGLSAPEYAKKFVLLKDAMHRVTHPIPAVDAIFAKMESDFFDWARSVGIQFSTTSDFLT